MAKKALSISLVVAMLATSNVPVWAAEDLFSDGGATVETPAAEIFSDDTGAVVEEAPAVQDAATLAVDDDYTNCSNVYITPDPKENGEVTISGHILKEDNKKLQEFNYRIYNNDRLVKEDNYKNTNGDINILVTNLETGDVQVEFYRNDDNFKFSNFFNPVSITNFNTGIGLKWESQGVEYTHGISYDKGTVTATATLPRELDTDETCNITLTDSEGNPLTGTTSETTGSGKTFYKTYSLSKEDIGKTIQAKVSVTLGNGTVYNNTTSSINVTNVYTTLEGTPVIKVDTGDVVRLGSKIYADTTNVTSTADPDFKDFGYMWQWYDTTANRWKNIGSDVAKMNKELELDVERHDWLYNKQIRVAVFAGDIFEVGESVISDEVTVGPAVYKEGATVEFFLEYENGNEIVDKEFNPLDQEANKLVDTQGKSLITVYYEGNVLKAGTDYTLAYKGNDQIGIVTVTITILPTAATNYSSGTFETKYELVAPTTVNESFVITSADSKSEYNGKTVTPKVTIKTDNGNTIVDESEYKVYSVGPDAGTYDINAYVEGQGMADNKEKKYTIEPKNIANHTSDFNVVIPDAVWDASEEAVRNNTL